MANISVDVASIVVAIQDCITRIRDENRAAKEREEQSCTLVYWALSIHPALDAMQPPSLEMGDLDWYNELHKTSSSWRFFGNVAKNAHFKKLSTLGAPGTRARIMLLLCWVIGHRLSEDKIRTLLSTAVGDALVEVSRIGSQEVQSSAALALDLIGELQLCNKAIKDIAKMIKTKLPLPPHNNPFFGDDFTPEDEDNPIPRNELWAYSLPAERRYEFDVKQHPSVLLQPHKDPLKVLIPQTKLSLLAIQWATRNFGLGKKIYREEDIDEAAFWNADPPLSSQTLTSRYLHTIE